MMQNAGSVAFVAVLAVLVTLASPATAGVGTAQAPGGSDASSTGPAVVSQADDGNSTNASETTLGENDTNASNASNATFGARLSSFMAASTADAENEIESGMFDARFERSNASERARLVQRRTEHIGDRIEELREQRQELLDREELTARERALAASLTVRANGLERSIDATVETAARINASINQTVIEELRASARNLTGRELVLVAGGPVGLVRSGEDEPGPPDDVPGRNADEKGGPPDGVPGQSGDGELGNSNGGGNGGGGPNGVRVDGTPTPTPEPEDGDAN